MTKYVKQYDDYSCGPIAIFNILKWCDERPQYRLIKQICNPDVHLGTVHANFCKALQHFLPQHVSVRYLIQPDVDVVVQHLMVGGVAIVCEHWTADDVEGEHYYCVAASKDTDSFVVINRDNKAKKLFNYDELKNSLQRHEISNYYEKDGQPPSYDDLLYPTAWLIFR